MGSSGMSVVEEKKRAVLEGEGREITAREEEAWERKRDRVEAAL